MDSNRDPAFIAAAGRSNANVVANIYEFGMGSRGSRPARRAVCRPAGRRPGIVNCY